ncbi:uncharacterized protein SPPG_01970 [Spizellomyces punctatus DAOM BR117]|uniref:C3H1-type domain-containing protein n=1 Tax=Spizellomyces punctatus (strain DAOM BR117) TaxID=645134 RepID=A0A0L0HPJ5_SPIPD|nr:uncharacterized protein SPPG_01970 [Spizellomyces punctatus DAOM BR117]KND02890.1 hypothetical protein SPPG_01970 [Spizellomyces punctatus DAOM BR117]|eukprot:XP_016610929.1 hypothetical protein SPPG_01970 [Spizellomyces punctatus DAOM BR117]
MDYTTHPEIKELLAQAAGLKNMANIPTTWHPLPPAAPPPVLSEREVDGERILLLQQQQQERRLSGNGGEVRGLCRFWQKGTCRYGDTCWFIHEGQQGAPTSPLQQNVQQNAQAAYCRSRDLCWPQHLQQLQQQQLQQLHQQQQLPYQTPNHSRTQSAGQGTFSSFHTIPLSRNSSRSVCRYWLQGICNRGPACRFLHGSAAPAAIGAAAAAIAERNALTAARPRPRPRSAPYIQTLPPSMDAMSTHPQLTRPRHYSHPSLLLPSLPTSTATYESLLESLPSSSPIPPLTEASSVDSFALPFDLDEYDDYSEAGLELGGLDENQVLGLLASSFPPSSAALIPSFAPVSPPSVSKPGSGVPRSSVPRSESEKLWKEDMWGASVLKALDRLAL